MNKKHFLTLVSFVLIALLLVACGGEAQVETVTVEVTRVPRGRINECRGRSRR